MELNEEDFARKAEKWLETNPYRTTLFGRVIDLSNAENIKPMAQWLAQVAKDIVEFDVQRDPESQAS